MDAPDDLAHSCETCGPATDEIGMMHPRLHDVRTLRTQDSMQSRKRLAAQKPGAFQIMQHGAGLVQTTCLLRPGLGIDGDDNAAKLCRIERFDEIHQHRLCAAAADAVGEVQHGGAFVLCHRTK